MAGPCYYEALMNVALNEDWIVPIQYGYFDTDGVTVLPIDLTGSMLKLEIRVQETDHEAIVYVASPDQGISFFEDDPTNGQFIITIDRGKLLRLWAGTFFTDLVRLQTNGYQERIFEGTAIVVTGTTR
ncbi:MAG TPA: hypothetical protein VGH47_04385 [Xanthobacteraceae bacterium]|jgi:hypothetical protein